MSFHWHVIVLYLSPILRYLCEIQYHAVFYFGSSLFAKETVDGLSVQNS